MDLKVNLDPEQINQLVAQAVLDSAIGEQVRQTVEEKVKELGRGYDNPIKKVVEAEILKTVRHLIETEFSDQIKEFVKAQLTEQFTTEIIQHLWDKFLERRF